MPSIRLTRVFSFESAHILWNHDGKCKNIHGHSYHLHVTISGPIRNEPGHPHDGMIMDFSELKKLVQQSVIESLDHALLISIHHPLLQTIETLQSHCEKIIVLPFQPTAENLVQYIAEQLQKALPSHIKLLKLKLSETTNSYVEWFAASGDME